MLLVNMHGFFLSKKRHNPKNDFQKNLDKTNPKPKKYEYTKVVNLIIEMNRNVFNI